MSTRIAFGLSVKEIKSAQKQLSRYKADIARKCQKFTEALADKGILVGEENVGAYGRYIVFSRETEAEKYGAKTVMYATNTGIIKSQWMTAEGVKEADVSPILMAEFGSGLRANNPRAKEMNPKMGTGTFPGQTHAEDPEGWWYMTLDGEWHHSKGVSPTMPMARAQAEIYDQIVSVAREVFGS